MKKLLLVLFLLLPSFLLAKNYESPISVYKPNYFLFGNMTDQVLFQISLKYNLVYPEKYGIFAGYTQRSWWRLYDTSSPFNESNYEPELFFLFKNKNNFLNKDLGYVDYIQLSPICHQSNGESGDINRSINTFYVKTQISTKCWWEGLQKKIKIWSIGTSLKLFGYYNKAEENSDIDKYKGFYEHELFVKMISKSVRYFDKEKLYFKHGMNFYTNKGWCETGLRIRLLTSKIQPYLFFQVFYGYGESLIFYHKKETNIRVGLTFE